MLQSGRHGLTLLAVVVAMVGVVGLGVAPKGVQAAEKTTKQVAPQPTCQLKLVEFYNPYCRHCKVMEPAVDQLMRKYGRWVTLEVVNTREAAGMKRADDFDISGTPTFLLFDMAELQDPQRASQAKPLGEVVGADPQGLDKLLETQTRQVKLRPGC